MILGHSRRTLLVENGHDLDRISLEGSHQTFLGLNIGCERNSEELLPRPLTWTTRGMKISSTQTKGLG